MNNQNHAIYSRVTICIVVISLISILTLSVIHANRENEVSDLHDVPETIVYADSAVSDRIEENDSPIEVNEIISSISTEYTDPEAEQHLVEAVTYFETSSEAETEAVYVETEPAQTAADTEAVGVYEETALDSVNVNNYAPAPDIDEDLPNGVYPDGSNYYPGQLIGTMKVTGYTAEEGFYRGSATASGVGVSEGMCAMNNTRRKELGIKYGDTIYIVGLGTYSVYDCGCSYNTVDIWLETNAEAYAITGYYYVYLIT